MNWSGVFWKHYIGHAVGGEWVVTNLICGAEELAEDGTCDVCRNDNFQHWTRVIAVVHFDMRTSFFFKFGF